MRSYRQGAAQTVLFEAALLVNKQMAVDNFSPEVYVRFLCAALFLFSVPALAKEVAFTFDDVPFDSTLHYGSS